MSATSTASAGLGTWLLIWCIYSGLTLRPSSMAWRLSSGRSERRVWTFLTSSSRLSISLDKSSWEHTLLLAKHKKNISSWWWRDILTPSKYWFDFFTRLLFKSYSCSFCSGWAVRTTMTTHVSQQTQKNANKFHMTGCKCVVCHHIPLICTNLIWTKILL